MHSQNYMRVRSMWVIGEYKQVCAYILVAVFVLTIPLSSGNQESCQASVDSTVVANDNGPVGFESEISSICEGLITHSDEIQFDESALENYSTDAVAASSTPQYLELRVCDIILASDSQMRGQYTDYANRMATAMVYVRDKYADQVGIWFEFEIIDIPADKCTSFVSVTLRDQFRQYMIDTYYPKTWDHAHLLTGKDLDGGLVAGISFYPGVGTEEYLTTGDDCGYTLSNYDGDDLARSHSTFGHELGHAFNADHVYAHRKDNIWPIMNEVTWMYSPYDPYFDERNDEFSVWNANRIRSWAEQTLDKALVYNHGPSSTDSNGLYVNEFRFYSDTFWIQPQSYKHITFSIHNTKSYSVTLKSLFIAGENEAGVDYILGLQSNVVIGANSAHVLSYDWYLTRAGAYEFWPAYITLSDTRVDVNLPMTVHCYYLEASKSGPIAHAGVSESSMCMFSKWYLFSTSGVMNVGAKVYAYCTLFSSYVDGHEYSDPGSAEDDVVEYSDIYIACRSPSDQNKDFGKLGQTTLSHEAWTFWADYGIHGLGGGATIRFAESHTLDSSGGWDFYPAWAVGSGSYFIPEDWGISLWISEPTSGGCVAEGTLITMADGSKKAVEDIKKGDFVLGYDPESDTFISQRVLEKSSSWSTQIININDGMLRVTSFDQPIYVMDFDGRVFWIQNPCEIQVGWKLYDVEDKLWITVEMIDIENEKCRVYDFLTDGFQTYIGNSILLMDKGKK